MSFFENITNFFKPENTDGASPEKPGRNEPCWCGSGRKYKKCHLAEDDIKAKQACSLSCGPT